MLGLDAGDGAVLIVRLGAVLHIGNSHGCSDQANGPKYKTRGYLVKHGLHRYLVE
jgi:hypothetical protein